MREKLVFVAEVLLLVGIGAAMGYFLIQYAKYGQSRKKQAVVEENTPERVDDHNICVRILGDDFCSKYHSSLDFTSLGEMQVSWGDRSEEGPLKKKELSQAFSLMETEENLFSEVICPEEGLQVSFTGDGLHLEWGAGYVVLEDSWICIEAADQQPVIISNLKRAGGPPEYFGRLCLWKENEGFGMLNVLPLESYLYSVVSSEMPSYYPVEAQKAQAVCARTYAQNCINSGMAMETAEDLDDSVNFQVYNNYPMTEASVQAVEETAGKILPLKEIQYYSTSSPSKGREDLGQEAAFRAFMENEPDEDMEYGSPWTRWTAWISKDALSSRVSEEYVSGPETQRENPDTFTQDTETQKENSGTFTEDTEAGALYLTVTKREADGRAQSLQACVGKNEVVVNGEYEIRRFLSAGLWKVELRDGSLPSNIGLLPSAYFFIEEETEEEIILLGGGYGHGNGMSQYGAAALAKKGLDYKEIIKYYYDVDI